MPPALAVAIFSACVSGISLVFSILSWRQANRPIVSARITTASGGNCGIVLNIIIENTGSRPARDIRLIASRADVVAALIPAEGEIPIDAQRCFFSNVSIPILANGRSTSNSFGHLGRQEGAWRPSAEIPIKIVYRDLWRRKFKSKMHLLLADDAGFAQTFWESSSKKG